MTLPELLGRLKRVRRSGHGYVASCPAHDDSHPSLSITQVADRILLNCFVGCSVRAICEALDIRLGDLLSAFESHSVDRWTDAERRAYARRTWEKSRRASGSVAETYLRNRGITMPIPPAIRFLPLLPHSKYGWPFPAMIAGIQDAACAFAGVLITWLCADGSDKAPVEPVRKIYGPYRGGAVRLAPADEVLAICEGLETGMSVMQACPELPVWCALSTSNLQRLLIPTTVRRVIVCADADEAGERAALFAARRFIAEKREAFIAKPARRKADFNDLRL